MKSIVILGAGVSGYGSAVLAQSLGFKVFVTDGGAIAPHIKAKLEAEAIPYEEGGHTLDKILSADEIILSPGIPFSAPVVVAAMKAGVPIVSEIEFAGRYVGSAKSICITGSNGKTTTTSLIYHILREAGYNVALGGNIGESFALSVARGEYDWYVLELSSFQLDSMFKFRADIALLLNITPDHLDRYDYSFDKYARSKMRITQNQAATDSFIYFADTAVIPPLMGGVKAHRVPFGQELSMAEMSDGAQIGSDGFVACIAGESVVIDADSLQIRGLHNLYNAAAATLAALTAGVKSEELVRALSSFQAIAHRMEPIATLDGVEWINDSKATNIDATLYALGSMQRPTVWIAGGVDKGNDYQLLMQAVKAKVHTLIAMGRDNTKLIEAFRGNIPNIVSTSSFEEAMAAAQGAAQSGDTVLLSPACASFDLFKNYEDRGERFREWVLERLKS